MILRAQCHSPSVPSLYLDPQIRDWVLFPITLVMVRCFHHHRFPTLALISHSLFQILVGVLRHYVVVLLQSSPTKLPRAAIREQCVHPHSWHVYSVVPSCLTQTQKNFQTSPRALQCPTRDIYKFSHTIPLLPGHIAGPVQGIR